MPMPFSRREFLRTTASACAATVLPAAFSSPARAEFETTMPVAMRPGLVTYNWGRDWDLPTVIQQCEATGLLGVELRSTHKHGVEITLDEAQRKDVKKRFDDSPVELVGLGSACEYHSADPAVVKKNIEETKAFVKLCHHVGGSGVKVRPNGFPPDLPMEKTLEQIGRSLREVAAYGADFNIAIRVEVHGRGTSLLPHIRTMLDIADHPNALVCWNCNPTDMEGEGLEHNFKLVQKQISTVHIHDLRNDQYPWKQLFALLKGSGFNGWAMIEEGSVPDDIPAAMRANRKLFDELLAG